MELKNKSLAAKKALTTRLLQWLNLRPEESKRTWMMFAFYTTVSVGLSWAENSTVALFLDEYGSGPLPLMYIASAVMSMALVVIYSWLQKLFPLRWVMVAIAPCMVVPLLLMVSLRGGIYLSFLTVAVVFILRLWVDALYVINDLNTSIVANQLFNIREIKRTYPLVSSGMLVADVISGFSLPWMLQFIKLEQVIIIACIVIVFGSGILYYLSLHYPEAFPEAPQRVILQEQSTRHRRMEGPLKSYTRYLFAFVGLLQIIGLLVDFQYLRELNLSLNSRDLASFLGLFGGIVGLFELMTQWFISSRITERFGVFVTAAMLPIVVGFIIPAAMMLLNLVPALQAQGFFWGLVGLKFVDELLRYTFVLSSGPVLYQPIPENIRSRTQTLSGGTAEAIATGLAGMIILVTVFVSNLYLSTYVQKWVLVIQTVIIAWGCLKVVLKLRSRYVELLVLTADRGELNAANVGLRYFHQEIIKAITEPGNTADKSSCIELLAQIDIQGSGQVLAPLLTKLPSDLQRQSLEVMLRGDINPIYALDARRLLEQPPGSVDPEVFALALRYVWLAETNPNLSQLEEYLQPRHHSLIRATAAALILRQGTPLQKIAATKTMRRMLTHKHERERVNGVRALREAVYLQALRIYIPNLLQDESLRVRCAVLEMIAATRLEDYYSALVAALHYKSTRSTAMQALVKLENEALDILLRVATDIYKPDIVRMYAWRTMAQIGTLEAMETLWTYLEKSWGTTRYYILRSLVKFNPQSEISSIDTFHQSQVETLINQELKFLGEIYAAYIDFEKSPTLETESSERLVVMTNLLQSALEELEMDVKERLLMLLKLLYSPEKMQAAAFNLKSESRANLAQGLEILDHTITLPTKALILNILDKRSPQDKLQYLVEAGLGEYNPMTIKQRISWMLTLSNFMSDWCLACCFHFAQVSRIRLSTDEILIALRHPTSFVREAAIAYLSVASRRVLLKLLPQLQKDSHPLVAAQVKELMAKYEINN
jgi:HEAT repeat protein